MIAHLSLLALLVLLSDVSPLDSATEPIAVNIVTSGEIEPEELKPAELQSALPEPSALAEPAPSALAPATPQVASTPQQPAKPGAAQPDRPAAAAPPKAQLGSASAGYRPPEPDLTVKYNVLLGLPPSCRRRRLRASRMKVLTKRPSLPTFRQACSRRSGGI
ncbi:MAG TPA: hypothetical protein VGD96_13185 [Bradyrhizobium sp.]